MELPLFPQVMDPRSQLLVHETPIPCSGNIVKMEAFRIADKNYVAVVVATNGSTVRDDNPIYNSAYYAHEQGGMVEYNMRPIEKYKGSAIFFHVESGYDRGSAGCITVPEEDVVEVLQWLDPEKSPYMLIRTQ